MFAGIQSFACGLHADQARVFVRNVGIENPHRIRATAHARDHGIGLAAHVFGHLRDALLADDRLKITHHHRIGMRSGDSADDVERVVHVRHPIAQRFVQRVFERFRSALHRHDSRAQKFHAINVLRLTFYVFRAHVHNAFEAIACGNRRCGNAVLPRARLCDHAWFAEAFCEQRLTDAVVDFVCAGVV